MFSHILLQEPLMPAHMDALLQIGWYRMHQHVFTTQMLFLENGVVAPVHWLRIRLDDYRMTRRHRRIRKEGRTFRSSMHDWRITPEIEALFSRYTEMVDFQTSGSVQDWLLEDQEQNLFPTKMWELRDGDKLIAVGYFDEGMESVASILHFYDPDYRHYSLGMWLYFETIWYAQETSKKYFYPGYIAEGYPKFDYKLEAGTQCIEVFVGGKEMWKKYHEWR